MRKNINKLEKIINILLFIIIIVVGIYFNYEKGNKTESIVDNRFPMKYQTSQSIMEKHMLK